MSAQDPRPIRLPESRQDRHPLPASAVLQHMKGEALRRGAAARRPGAQRSKGPTWRKLAGGTLLRFRNLPLGARPAGGAPTRSALCPLSPGRGRVSRPVWAQTPRELRGLNSGARGRATWRLLPAGVRPSMGYDDSSASPILSIQLSPPWKLGAPRPVCCPRTIHRRCPRTNCLARRAYGRSPIRAPHGAVCNGMTASMGGLSGCVADRAGEARISARAGHRRVPA